MNTSEKTAASDSNLAAKRSIDNSIYFHHFQLSDSFLNSKSVAEGRNKKRGRLSSLIKERAEKKKALMDEENKTNDISVSTSIYALKNHVPLSPSDPRFLYSKLILDALNTGDIDNFEEILKRLCSPDVISTHIYTGTLEHNPLGPNSRVIIGYDAIMSVWRDWFKIAPDSIFLLQNPTATVDKKTSEFLFISFFLPLFSYLFHSLCRYRDFQHPLYEFIHPRAGGKAESREIRFRKNGKCQEQSLLCDSEYSHRNRQYNCSATTKSKPHESHSDPQQ